MRPLTREDIVPIETYEQMREQFRRRIIDIKKVRRVDIGPRISVVFENRDTMRFQIQEMCRIEHITQPELIQQELDVYNDLLPLGYAIGATLLIALSQEDNMPEILRQLSGVEEHVYLETDKFRIHAQAELGRSTEEKTSAVHYLTFTFTKEQVQQFAESERNTIAIHHPHYDYGVALPEVTKASLLADLIQER
ncbi:DUF3501 family protein [Sulfobacillus thermosulfidooxidans]|uniref:DUF3501 family protein n=1 Tax=Sulfobacillus thermosulfidooxidans TaxID=28034 RepID=UPI00096BBF58|nr:DUF3501 family protein [Sulfobacillus thermosulfidooxidans]OLZ10000.1 hypothetical protein BFX05_13920 [Sulfobacillus thermosulfidooxidans]OLZ15695.1 hypothetical protein BFX06_01120 [Sulfobacillus thermosulfidooxidans]OLZ18459.1 hypothetical protein BFX07_09005 [Sulfobacillus thermosulfidooxidans]